MEISENKLTIKFLKELGFEEYVENAILLVIEKDPNTSEKAVRRRRFYHPLSLKEDIYTFSTNDIKFGTIMHYILYHQLIKDNNNILDLDVDKAISFARNKPTVSEFQNKIYNLMKEALEFKMVQHPFLKEIIKNIESPVKYYSKDTYYGKTKKITKGQAINDSEQEIGKNMYGKFLDTLIKKITPERPREIVSATDTEYVEGLTEKVELKGIIYIYPGVFDIEWQTILNIAQSAIQNVLMVIEREVYGLEYIRQMSYDDLNVASVYKVVSRSHSKRKYFCIQDSAEIRLYLEKLEDDKYSFFVHASEQSSEMRIANLIRSLL